LALGLVWFGFAFKGKQDNLRLAQAQIDSARLMRQLVSQSLNGVKTDIETTRGYLDTIKKEALSAKNDLSNLQAERDKIHKNINQTIENGRSSLVQHQRSIDDILASQRALLKSLEGIKIDSLIIEPSKKIVQ
jgi:uncharacterized protein (DUF3084 family)